MSQAIQAFTSLPPAYQGNLQQQASAALASSSLSMQGDSISPVAIGLVVTTGGLLTAAAVTLAVKHFSTSSDKPKSAQATSLGSKPVKREESAQIESDPTPTSTEKTLLPQPVSPPHQYILPPQPTRQSQYITLPGLPGFIDPSDGIYREQQIGGLCVMHALNTVLYKLFGTEGIITKEELIEKFGEEIIDNGLTESQLMQLAQEKGLEMRRYDAALFEGGNITSIGDARAFIIREPTSYPLYPFHAVAIVHSREGFCLSDSYHQDKREIYLGDADKALHDHQISYNLTAREVITFHKRVPARGVVL